MEHIIALLRDEFEKKKDEIRSIIGSFEQKIKRCDDAELFDEFVYVILAAGSSASSALRGEKALRGIYKFRNRVPKKLVFEMLKKASCRFWKTKGEYIIDALKRLKRESFKEEITKRLDDPEELRFYLTTFSGVGFKAASHFLRNIGIFGFAILDKHILNSLVEFGVIESVPKQINPGKYLYLEKKFKEFANTVGISIEELDLLLWSRKTGRLLK